MWMMQELYWIVRHTCWRACDLCNFKPINILCLCISYSHSVDFLYTNNIVKVVKKKRSSTSNCNIDISIELHWEYKSIYTPPTYHSIILENFFSRNYEKFNVHNFVSQFCNRFWNVTSHELYTTITEKN